MDSNDFNFIALLFSKLNSGLTFSQRTFRMGLFSGGLTYGGGGVGGVGPFFRMKIRVLIILGFVIYIWAQCFGADNKSLNQHYRYLSILEQCK